MTRRFWTLFDIALDQNTPMGLYWEYRDYGQNRTADEPQSPTVDMRIACPSQHEKVEARLQLRDWLKGIYPPHEVEALLNDEAHMPLPKTQW